MGERAQAIAKVHDRPNEIAGERGGGDGTRNENREPRHQQRQVVHNVEKEARFRRNGDPVANSVLQDGLRLCRTLVRADKRLRALRETQAQRHRLLACADEARGSVLTIPCKHIRRQRQNERSLLILPIAAGGRDLKDVDDHDYDGERHCKRQPDRREELPEKPGHGQSTRSW